ncbi:alpha-2-macroglobulin-like isoform X2 [Clytia hemisphaerica]|uniref:Uncharacterized protein n=1 Tax=Clytia hemisphaerica TaxID=252671 RepID=A0A7M5X170_9CNID
MALQPRTAFISALVIFFVVGAQARIKIRKIKLPPLPKKPVYLVTIPRVVFPGEITTATFSIPPLKKGFTLTVRLNHRESIDISQEVVTEVMARDRRQLITIPIRVDERKFGSEKRIVFKFSTDSAETDEMPFTAKPLNLEVKSLKDRLFIQTDKPIYKPGGKVRFRLVSVNKNLKPNSETIDQVYILNPTGSRVMQWTNHTLDGGMSSFEMALSIKPVLGTWKIVAKSEKLKAEVSIKVEKYVLPKFKVDITTPSYIMDDDTTITTKICGKYTYGKEVSGKLEASLCLKPNSYLLRIRSDDKKTFCININKKIKGCENIEFPLKKMMNKPKRLRYSDSYSKYSLKVIANLTEEGTAIKQTEEHQSKHFSRQPYEIKFEIPKYFKPGMIFPVKMLVNTPDGRPKQTPTKVWLTISPTPGRRQKRLVTVINGYDEFNVFPRADSTKYIFNAEGVLPTKKSEVIKKKKGRGQGSRHLRQRNRLPTASGRSMAWHSRSKSFLSISGPTSVAVDQYATFNVDFTKADYKDINFLVICRGVVQESSILSNIEKYTKLRIFIRNGMSPKCRLLVYYFHERELVADSHTFDVSMDTRNKVSMSFKDSEKKPGSQVELLLKASPGSKFAVSAVDESIRLMAQTNDIKEEQLNSVLLEQDVERRTRRNRWGCWNHHERKVDSTEALEESGLRFLTNAEDRLPDRSYCIYDYEDRHMVAFARPALEMGAVPAPGVRRMRPNIRQNSMVRKTKFRTKIQTKQEEPQQLKVRTEFPESWLWFDEYISSNGEKKMSVKIPDTITTWHANGFALSASDGIGISKPTTIRGFQPFFISLTLPYSVKRGEILKIPATVFNYLDKCLVIGIELDESKDYEELTSSQQKLCVCGGEAKTVKFGIKPKTLGKIDITVKGRSYEASSSVCGPNQVPISNVVAADALTKKLLVEAEGIKKEYSTSLFFCPNDHANGTFSDVISLDLPEKIVPGSVYAEIEFVGDLLGPSMDGLDKLLAMPYGCGEQNMLKFAPNVYIMDYLTATEQSDGKIVNKAKKFMQSGYQRELTYKHNNGGYSAFGKRDKEASTWLTAFVLRTYAQAQKYIFIDDKDIKDSVNFLLKLQQRDGCFKKIGMVHHKEMTGGVTSGVTMTAFVVTALIEAGVTENDGRIQSAMRCMEQQLDSVKDTYTLSVLAFALKMAGSSKTDQLLKRLDDKATREGGLIHWDDGKPKPQYSPRTCYIPRAKSLDIEMTSYALMALISGEQPYGNRREHLDIVKWLVKQRNSYGGFASTQDTCVGLQALAQYSASTFNGNFDMSIKTQSNKQSGGTDLDVSITKTNRLVLQKFHLQESLPVNLTVTATGQGCALAQANVKYNEPQPGKEESFKLKVNVKKDENSLTCRHQMKICGSYTGTGKSNMALIDINMVSGFEPIINELEMQQQMTDVSYTQFEFIDGVLSFYFNDFSETTQCVDFFMEQVAQVEGRKPASVKIYDYYDKDNEATQMYKVGDCPEINTVS